MERTEEKGGNLVKSGEAIGKWERNESDSSTAVVFLPATQTVTPTKDVSGV